MRLPLMTTIFHVFYLPRTVGLARRVLLRFAYSGCEGPTKMGQLRLAIDPFGKLVAGTGFEPVTFGL